MDGENACTFFTMSNLWPLLDSVEVLSHNVRSLIPGPIFYSINYIHPELTLALASEIVPRTLTVSSITTKRLSCLESLSAILVSSSFLEVLEHIQKIDRCFSETMEDLGTCFSSSFSRHIPLIFYILLNTKIIVQGLLLAQGPFPISPSLSLAFWLTCSYYSSGAEH